MNPASASAFHGWRGFLAHMQFLRNKALCQCTVGSSPGPGVGLVDTIVIFLNIHLGSGSHKGQGGSSWHRGALWLGMCMVGYT